jgi:hypothetical protein
MRKLKEHKQRAEKWKSRCRQLAEQFAALSHQLQQARAVTSVEVRPALALQMHAPRVHMHACGLSHLRYLLGPSAVYMKSDSNSTC